MNYEINNIYVIQKFILNTIKELGPQTIEDLMKYIQSVNYQNQYKTMKYCLKSLLDYNKIIRKKLPDDKLVYDILGYSHINKESQLSSVRKSLAFIQYLIQYKNDETNLFVYFNSIKSIEVNLSYPRTLKIEFNNSFYEIDFVDSMETDDFNEVVKLRDESELEKNRFLISDQYLDISDIELPEQYLNIITVDDDFNVTIVR